MSAGEITQEAIDEFVAVSFARQFAFSRTAAASLGIPVAPDRADSPLPNPRKRAADSPTIPRVLSVQAARYGDMEDVQSYLSQGVSPDAADVEGRTALFFASANGHLEVVEHLLAKDADPNIANAQGNTALHWACVNGHGEVATRLLAAGAKTTLVNAGGRTALDEAMHNDRQACVDAIISASGVEEEEAEFEDDVEVEGEEPEDQGPETEADR